MGCEAQDPTAGAGSAANGSATAVAPVTGAGEVPAPPVIENPPTELIATAFTCADPEASPASALLELMAMSPPVTVTTAAPLAWNASFADESSTKMLFGETEPIIPEIALAPVLDGIGEEVPVDGLQPGLVGADGNGSGSSDETYQARWEAALDGDLYRRNGDRRQGHAGDAGGVAQGNGIG